MTEAQFQELQNRIEGVTQASGISKPHRAAPKRPEPVSGPLSVLLTLHGHCPSKKNSWTSSASGGVRIPTEVKRQIEALTLQAMLVWGRDVGAPVENPNLTLWFYVHHARRDQDGMYTTILDCLQAAGVIVNDNLARCNGRKILEPAVFVSEADERVEILVDKK